MITSGKTPVFYTVTNQHYFPGTVAALSSIRTFHPENPIWVFSESRSPLTSAQFHHLESLPGVKHLRGEDVPFGKIKEAWQLKAHAAKYLSTLYDGVIIQVDSDVVICSSLDDLALEAFSKQAPIGGKDGNGPMYPHGSYHHYGKLCSCPPITEDVRNPIYISSSVLFMPVEPLREVFDLWSIGVDEAEFGPKEREVKIYPGCGDQGVLNAILFFKGIERSAFENDLISQHWTHGKNPVTFSDGAFWNDGKKQRSFHSVGKSPKFWTKGYPEQVEKNPNLKEVYLYWLFHLFDGPCGYLTTYSPRKVDALRGELFGNSSPNLLEQYNKRRGPSFKRVIRDFGRLNATPIMPPFFTKRESANALITTVFNGYVDYREHVHYFYSAVRRLQSYRLLGGTADLIIIANDCALEQFCDANLVSVMNRYKIRVVRSSNEHIRQLFAAHEIDIEMLRLGSIAGIEKGKKDGRYTDQLKGSHNMVDGLEIYLGRFFLVNDIARAQGYEKIALTDADGGSYHFEEKEIPQGCHVDDIWRFSEFTDFLYQQTSTGRTEMHYVSAKGLSRLFELRREEAALPMFQVSAQWTQGTAEALSHYVSLAAREIKRQYAYGFYPGDELVFTAIIYGGQMSPRYGAIVGHSLKRQLEVIQGSTDLWDPPFYTKKGEDKYVRCFLQPPARSKRYAVCICGFDPPASKGNHYSNAALGRALAYRETMQGGMDVHIYTNNPSLPAKPGVTFHQCTVEELTTSWDPRATYRQLHEIQHEACADPARHKDGRFGKRPELALGMLSKLMAMERTVQLGYGGVMSADADGNQFSMETIGSLGRRHIDAIWAALDHHSMLCYNVGTARDSSFNTWLTVLRELAEGSGDNNGPLDWIWGPCWMIEAGFAARFFAGARKVFKRALDRRIVFYDEHMLNCTYNLPEFDDDLLRIIRDLGDAAQIGYRELNPKSLVRYKRWSTNAIFTGRKYRKPSFNAPPEFTYAT